tara:strand:- start:146 stop:1132 length:987 start_codon:yes stop_codon:yes gene_type:complete
MALSATQIQKLIEDDGYPAFFESYDRQQPLYPAIAEVVDVSQAGAPEYGDKGSTFQNVDRFKEREDGAEVEDSTLNEAHTWQIKIRTYSRRIRIPERIIANNDTEAARSILTQAASGWGQLAPLQKDDFVAQLFQKGTLTAGDTDYFDNSYLKNADPNRGFIYDGLPWFDTAHARSDGSGTYVNHSPSTALTQANLESVMTTMTTTNAVDDRGERILINPTHLIVPGGLQFDAQRILRTSQAIGSNNNDINPLFNQLIPVTWRALSDSASSSAWWVIQAGMGLRVYDSPVRLRQYQERNGDISVIAQYRFGAGVTNWRFAYCANKDAT